MRALAGREDLHSERRRGPPLAPPAAPEEEMLRPSTLGRVGSLPLRVAAEYTLRLRAGSRVGVPGTAEVCVQVGSGRSEGMEAECGSGVR